MKYILLLIIWVLPFSVLSEEKYSISGIVNDDTSKEAIISATVALYNDSVINKDNFVKGAYSNKFGFYSLPNISSGTYYLAVSSVGYKIKLTKLTVANDDLRQNIQLESVSVMTQELTVTADRESSPTSSISSISISPSFVSKMPAFGGEVDIFRTLQLLPGIAAGSELSSGLYVRGGSPDQNLILLDGVTVYNPSHLAGFISSFNNDAIKDIRMIKGAFPAEYGGRLSSVLDLTMKEGRKDKVGGKAGISLISSKLTVEGPINENSSFMISGRRFYFDLLLGLITNDAPTYYFYDFNAKANYKLSDNDVLYVSGYFARDVFGVNENDNDDISVNWGNSTANMRWMHIVNPELFTNFSLVYTDYIFDSNIGEEDVIFNTGSRIRDIVLKGDAQYLAYDNHIIKTGADITWHNFNAKANFNESNINEADFLGEGNINTFDIALYAQDEWKATDRLDVNYGLRGYYFQQGNYLDIEPRLSATYLTGEGVRLKGAFAVANQYIHLVVRNNISLPTDLWFPSTENILPSRSYQGVLGAEMNIIDDTYLISLEGYYKKMDNLLEYRDDAEFTLGIPLEEQFTRGEGRAYGIELFLNKKIGNFTGWVGYTLAWTKRQFDDLNNGKEFYPRYDRRHDISVTLNYEFSDVWELGLAWVYGTGQAFTMPTSTYYWREDYDYYNDKYQFSDRNGVRLPAYHRMDLNFMYKFKAYNLPWVLSINIYNVYDRRNPFAWYINNEYDPQTGDYKKQLKQITLFPIIPTLGLSFEF